MSPEAVISHFHWGSILWVIEQVLGQDGWILAEFCFFCVFMDQGPRSINTQKKKERGQYPAILTEQAWSIKNLYGFWGNFLAGQGG